MEYVNHRSKLDNIYEQKNNCVRIRSKCNWYEYTENSSKKVFNFEKSRLAQNTIQNITKHGKSLTNHKTINQELFDFYKNLISKILTRPKMKLCNFQI